MSPTTRPDAGSPSDILTVDRLAVAFGSTRVLADLSFRVRRGECLAIIGPNGSGKTVLFQALVGSIPARGRIAWAAGTRIGYVPQKLDIERDLPITGRDLLVAKQRVVHAQADFSVLVRRVGLGGELERPIGALSGGQFQRLLVALALVGDPDVLLLDEFTAGVDSPGQVRLTDLVRELQLADGLTILTISHDLSIVKHSATSVLCLGHARAWFGTPSEVLTQDTLHAAYGAPLELHGDG